MSAVATARFAEVVTQGGTTMQPLVDREHELRRAFLEPQTPQAKLLLEWVGFLELNLALCGLAEALHSLGGASPSGDMDWSRVERIAAGLTGLDVRAVLDANLPLLENATSAAVTATRQVTAKRAVPGAMTVIRTIVASAPMQSLRDFGSEPGLVSLSHRAVAAFERLRAVLRRNDPASDPRLLAMGRAYAEGRLQLEEVATMMGVPSEDAVAWLETNGFSRPLEVIRLSPEERTARMAAITAMRATGAESSLNDEGSIRREVLASQRIEDVDARPWLPPAKA